MDIKLIRNLLIKVSIDGSYSICETCIHMNANIPCKYLSKDKCTDNLEEYVPNENMINF